MRIPMLGLVAMFATAILGLQCSDEIGGAAHADVRPRGSTFWTVQQYCGDSRSEVPCVWSAMLHHEDGRFVPCFRYHFADGGGLLCDWDAAH